MRDNKANNIRLPPIPEKRYFSISEVVTLCAVKAHVLRYWEQEFPKLKPNKRRGNRRYYQRKDVLLIRKIRELLYQQGYTIDGARNALQNQLATKKEVEHAENPIREIILELETLLKHLEQII